MLGFEEVTYAFATITCDWPGCDNRINLRPGPIDVRMNSEELSHLRRIAEQYGWIITDGDPATQCQYHTRKESK